jgi:hypothetical protein
MSFIALLGGLAAKLYDDLSDNKMLKKYRNKTFIEFLKGIHYITFTTISIYEPLFYIIHLIANVINYIANMDAYNPPYEHSLLYSFLILFFILDYSKITSICLMDKILTISFITSMFFEPIIMFYFLKNSEFSFEKMIIRSIMAFNVFIAYLLSTSNTVKYTFAYCFGYLFCSAVIQAYSVYKKNKKLKIKDKLKFK